MSEQSKEHHRRHYAKNKESVKRKNLARKKEIQLWYQKIKAELTCSRCPENHPACLHFHHIDPANKISSVAFAVRDGRSKQSILEEMSKCVVLCANCHAKEHAKFLSGIDVSG